MVYLATDPDREGEAIAWHLQQALDLPDERVRRVTFHEITERAVKEAFSHVGPINMDMVNAQQARRFLDRFVGYQLSPLLWKQGRPQPERRPRPVGRRPADRRPRDARSGPSSPRNTGRSPRRSARPARPPRPTGSRPPWPSTTGPKFEAKTEAEAHAVRDALAVGHLRRSRRSTRPRSSTRPTPRSRPARSSSRRRSGCGSPARGP